MKINEFDTVLLKDGREGDVMEVNGEDSVDMVIGDSPENWENLWSVPISEIEKVIHSSEP